MSNKGLEFDAGNDFAQSPMDAISSSTAPEPSPEPVTSTEGGSDVAQPEVEEQVGVPAGWADNNEPEAPETEESPSTDDGPYIELKGADGSVKKFALDPGNDDLRRALGKGTVADKWRNERDTARREIRDLRREVEKMRAASEKASKVDSVEELKSLGQHTAAARAALGDEGFSKFVEDVREALHVELSGDPDTVRDYEDKVAQRQRDLDNHQRSKREQELERRLEEIEERGHLSRFRAAASAALQQHNFSNYVEDPHIAEQLNDRTWRLAAADLKSYAAKKDLGPDQITEQMIHKAVARNAKLLRGGRIKVADQRTDSIIEKKKQEAKENAQIIATQRYPGGQAKEMEDAIASWNKSGGRSSKDLLRALIGKK